MYEIGRSYLVRATRGFGSEDLSEFKILNVIIDKTTSGNNKLIKIAIMDGKTRWFNLDYIERVYHVIAEVPEVEIIESINIKEDRYREEILKMMREVVNSMAVDVIRKPINL